MLIFNIFYSPERKSPRPDFFIILQPGFPHVSCHMLSDLIHISDFSYELPDGQIARFPLEQRDATRLLMVKGNTVHDSEFPRLPEFIPSGSMLVFNNTRVIKARLVFRKESGSRIEIFCLQPLGGYGQTGGTARWKCLTGNARRWKSGLLEMQVQTDSGPVTLKAGKGAEVAGAREITFYWDNPAMPFEQVLEFAGNVPLPPYLNREPVEEDAIRYQTIYAEHNGSVAAPTAGLHFTQAVMKQLGARGCAFEYLTLHVGAGTFRPVTSEDIREHSMHEEEIIVERNRLLNIINHLPQPIVPVGTTSMRTLESLYWLGVQILTGREPEDTFHITQWEPYRNDVNIPAAEALQAIYDFLKRERLQSISGFTGIMIVPGYRFRLCNALVTNFHQPKSTLLLLVAAFIGDTWKSAYKHAVDRGYRFLSYGDSCLFIPAPAGE